MRRSSLVHCCHFSTLLPSRQGVPKNVFWVFCFIFSWPLSEPTGQDWRLPLLVYLLEIKDDQWVIEFDEETDKFSENEVTSLVNNVCIN